MKKEQTKRIHSLPNYGKQEQQLLLSTIWEKQPCKECGKRIDYTAAVCEFCGAPIVPF